MKKLDELSQRYKNFIRFLEIQKTYNIFGKSFIVNTLAISKLIYADTFLTTSDDEFIIGINRIILNFIWNKKDRIRRNILVGEDNYS